MSLETPDVLDPGGTQVVITLGKVLPTFLEQVAVLMHGEGFFVLNQSEALPHHEVIVVINTEHGLYLEWDDVSEHLNCFANLSGSCEEDINGPLPLAEVPETTKRRDALSE